MVEKNFSVEYLEDLALFRVRLFQDVSEKTVQNCFEAYEQQVAFHYHGNDFRLMINNSGYRPATERAHRLIRELFTNQVHKASCVKVAIVNENIPLFDKRNERWVDRVEGFFSNEVEAFDWLGRDI